MDNLRRNASDILERISSIFSNDDETNANLRQFWMPDAVSVDCYECQAIFTTFRRKHRCRVCGQIFCHRCSNQYIPGKFLDCKKNLRVCQFCFDFLKPYINDATNIEDFRDMVNGATASGSPAIEPSGPGLLAEAANSRARRISTLSNVFQAPGDNHIQSEESGSGGHGEVPELLHLTDTQHLLQLWEKITASEEEGGIRLDTHKHQNRNYPMSFTGADLTEWLQRRDGTTAEQEAASIAQALYDQGYFTSLANADGNHQFNPSMPYRPSQLDRRESGSMVPDVSMIPSATIATGEDQGPEWLRQAKTPSTTRVETTSAENDSPDAAMDLASSPLYGSDISQLGVIEKYQGQIANKLEAQKLKKTYWDHEHFYLRKLMIEETLDDKWEFKIEDLVERVFTNITSEDPYMRYNTNADDIDLPSYVHVKKIPGGAMRECTIVDGVVCTKWLKEEMPQEIQNPRILLVKEFIDSRNPKKYTSIDGLKLQQDEHDSNMTSKILSLQPVPHVLICQEHVSGNIQNALTERSIAVVPKMKETTMLRLQRLTRTRITESFIRSSTNLTAPAIGGCGLFRNMVYRINDQPKNFMFFQGCPKNLGCTIILRGGPVGELAKVKRIIQRLLRLRVNHRYEQEFLAIEYADIGNQFFRLGEAGINELSLSPFIKIPYNKNEDSFTSSQPSKPNPPEQPPEKPIIKRKKKYRDPVSVDLSSELNEENLALFRAQSGQVILSKGLDPIVKEDPLPVPQYYQRITKRFPVLFSSFGPANKSKTLPVCTVPFIVNMHFYGDMDLPLGQFLEMFVFNPQYQCHNKTCSSPMEQHIRRFCHANGILTMTSHSAEIDSLKEHPNEIFTWKWCERCERMTPMLAMTEKSLMYSYAMFLMLTICDTSQTPRAPPNQPTEDRCTHSLHQDHITFFAKDKKLATFRYSQCERHEIALPPKVVYVPKPQFTIDQLHDEMKSLSVEGVKKFGSINAKLVKLQYECEENTPLNDKVLWSIEEQQSDKTHFMECIEKVKDKLHPSGSSEAELMDAKVLLITAQKNLAINIHKWKKQLQEIAELAKKKEKKLSMERLRQPSGTTTPREDIPDGENGTRPKDRAKEKSKEAAKDMTTQSNRKKSEETSGPSRFVHSIINTTSEDRLTSPFSPTAHFLLHSPRHITVDEKKPSSIIAYTMTTGAYLEFLSHCQQTPSDSVPSSGENLSAPVHQQQQHHFEYQFSDETTNFYCCAYFATDFFRLRERIVALASPSSNGSQTSLDEEQFHSAASSDAEELSLPVNEGAPRTPEDFYIWSLGECFQWNASGGKSGLAFYKTSNDRFILKQMNSFEFKSFQNFAPHYFRYINESLTKGKPSALARILGVYKVGFKNNLTGDSLKLDVLVIENLFYGRTIAQTFDLKGSVRNRLVDTADKPDVVMQDENLIKMSSERPLCVRDRSKKMLLQAIQRDSEFLANNNLMDYSLVVGRDGETNELILGIIDYIRNFTWDKKIENLVKSGAGLLTGGPIKAPTIISPTLYKERFSSAMYQYFIVVPDFWYMPPRKKRNVNSGNGNLKQIKDMAEKEGRKTGSSRESTPRGNIQ